MSDKRPPIDLVNAERPIDERPASSQESNAQERSWLGSAAGEVLYWKQRAIAAEALVAKLRGEIAGLRTELPTKPETPAALRRREQKG